MKTAYIAAMVIGAGVLGALGGGWVARMDGHDMAEHDMSAMAGHDMAGHDMGAMPAWAAQYDAANDAMHQGMMIPYSDNADLDFARGMVPHHQGAVAMAKIQLDHGTDPDMRKLAEGIIAAQETEISFMQGWIAAHSQ